MAKRRGRGRREHEVHRMVRIAHQTEPPHRVLMACHYGARYAGCDHVEVVEPPPTAVAVMPKPKRPARKGATR